MDSLYKVTVILGLMLIAYRQGSIWRAMEGMAQSLEYRKRWNLDGQDHDE